MKMGEATINLPTGLQCPIFEALKIHVKSARSFGLSNRGTLSKFSLESSNYGHQPIRKVFLQGHNFSEPLEITFFCNHRSTDGKENIYFFWVGKIKTVPKYLKPVI